MKIIINAEDAIVGRLGSYVAKELLKGNSVVIINSEKAIISGKRENILERIRNLRRKGGSSLRGPKISKLPDRLLKRMIRGMLPWKKTRGREAYKRLKCCCSAGDLKKEELEKAKKLDFKKPLRFITIGDISKDLK
jgi:large subunit ribosomal protein L13